MKSEPLPYGRHELDEDDIASVVAVLRGKSLTQGPTVAEFEAALVAATDARFAVSVSSGTAALHLAYSALGLGPGDELITSPLTFVATANAARQLGARVVFADVDAQGNLDPESVATKITPRTRGIAAVHFAGLPADLPRLGALARQHGLFLVEDAAHALGAKMAGHKIGGAQSSDLVTFSFHPVKHITTAEGGAVVGGARVELVESLRRKREHGLTREPAPDSEGLYGYVLTELGYNYRLSDLNAALGLSQLKKLERFVQRRRAIAHYYRGEFSGLDPAIFSCLDEPPLRESAHHLFPVLIDFQRLGISRGLFMRALRERGVGSQVHYIPVSDQPLYRDPSDPNPCPRARRFFERELSLPIFPGMSDLDVERVVEGVRGVVANFLLRRAV